MMILNKAKFFKITVSAAVAAFLIVIVFQNCAPAHYGVITESSNLSSQTVDTKQLKSCQFLGPQAISNVLKNQLGISRGDIEMVNESGQPLKSDNCKSYVHNSAGKECFYLNEYKEELSTKECNETTYKVISKIMINACQRAMNTDKVAQSLFPAGSKNVEQLYMLFTAQPIRPNEKEILDELAATFDSEKQKQVALCAAVGSSFAATSIF